MYVTKQVSLLHFAREEPETEWGPNQAKTALSQPPFPLFGHQSLLAQPSSSFSFS